MNIEKPKKRKRKSTHQKSRKETNKQMKNEKSKNGKRKSTNQKSRKEKIKNEQ